MTTYQVVEIFDSIDGEGLRTGALVSFIRLAGCNLRCSYCDTLYALFHEAEPCRYTDMTLDEILAQVNPNWKRVTLTGGEPLIAPGAVELVNALTQQGYEVNIETNGAVELAPFTQGLTHPEKMFFTVDYKLPSSGMTDKMVESNFFSLRPQDVVKLVCGSREDLDVAARLVEQILSRCPQPPHIFLGAVYGMLSNQELVSYMQKTPSFKNARLQLQIHKIIWDPEQKGV